MKLYTLIVLIHYSINIQTLTDEISKAFQDIDFARLFYCFNNQYGGTIRNTMTFKTQKQIPKNKSLSNRWEYLEW